MKNWMGAQSLAARKLRTAQNDSFRTLNAVTDQDSFRAGSARLNPSRIREKFGRRKHLPRPRPCRFVTVLLFGL
jgi:hypothetical protein